MDESLKIRLLKGIGNDSLMRVILANMMERTQAEFCAFYTSRERDLAYIMAESRELSPRIPEIREKLGKAYRMFTNGLGSSESEPLEKIYYRRGGANVAYLVSNSKIESYFLVPVSLGAKVRGVLFFGSIRKEAFGRNDIAVFRSLADEGEEKSPLIFRVGGEREILERLLEVHPAGAALISPDGRIVSANRAFREILRVNDELPGSVYEVGKASCFNLHGVWEEFSILQRNVIDRDLEGMCVPERYLSVSWVRLDDLSEEVGSLVVFRDTTASREQAEAREEMVAIVAHELRTPLTALKNSLAIVEGSDIPTAARFLSNAMRTVDRLGRLVDSLIDSSAARIDDRPLKSEPHDLKGFLEDVSLLFIEPMRRKGIDFAIEVDAASAKLTFDKDRMEQVIQNLLANSIKHVPRGGKISISASPGIGGPAHIAPPALLKHIPDVAFADLCLRDSGSGIPSDVAEQVNLSGFRERPARASKGLGLVIAKRLMRLHGGSLVVEEGREGGSAVHLYIPVDQETARLVQNLRIMEMRVDEMLARGLTPVVYSVVKRSPGPWSEAGAPGHPAPIVNPARAERAENAVYLWPLTGGFALALSARSELGGESSSSFEGVEMGWAIGPREGTELKELLEVALERMGGAALAPAVKGDSA